MRWILAALLGAWIMAAGVTSDATDVMIYDDANAAAGGDGSYSFADIFAVLGGTGVDVLRVDSGTGVPHYRFLKHLQIGDKTTNTATTTLKDDNVVVTFDTGKVLKTRATQTTSWFTELGVKVGTGSQASGKKSVILTFHNTAGTNSCVIRGSVKCYGVMFKSTQTGGTQALQFPSMTTSDPNKSEFFNCILDGFTGYVLGSSGFPIETLYNVDIAGDPGGAVITSFFVNFPDRLTFGGNPGTTYLSSGTADIGMRDVLTFGAPTFASFSATGSAPNWKMAGVRYIEGIAKYGTAGSTVGTDDDRANNGPHDYMLYGVLCVDGAGAAVSGIPVKLTDTQGNVQVDTTTGSGGEINFGSGLTENRVIVADHYMAGGTTYTIRSRSPFLVEINTPSQAGYNNNYFSHRYYFNWPGSADYTTTSGTLGDVDDIATMSAAPSGGSTWVERIVP